MHVDAHCPKNVSERVFRISAVLTWYPKRVKRWSFFINEVYISQCLDLLTLYISIFWFFYKWSFLHVMSAEVYYNHYKWRLNSNKVMTRSAIASHWSMMVKRKIFSQLGHLMSYKFAVGICIYIYICYIYLSIYLSMYLSIYVSIYLSGPCLRLDPKLMAVHPISIEQT